MKITDRQRIDWLIRYDLNVCLLMPMNRPDMMHGVDFPLNSRRAIDKAIRAIKRGRNK